MTTTKPQRLPLLTTLLSGAALAGLMSTPAIAQDTNADEEIVVTATRRAEDILDVPYNISAVTGAQIEEARMRDSTELLRSIPGVSVVDRGERNSATVNGVRIRGLNVDSAALGDYAVSAVSTVSTYVNDTPIFANFLLTDIAQVEVLRGPQGTLYGSGALGGTVRYIMNAPEIGAYGGQGQISLSQVEGSEDAGWGGDLTINLPLGDRAAFRGTIARADYPGVTDYVNLYELDSGGIPTAPSGVLNPAASYTSREDADTVDVWFGRASLLVKPTDTIDLTLNYFHQSDEIGGRRGQTLGSDGFGNPYGDYESGSIQLEPSDRDLDLISLEANIDLGFATLTSSTSYYDHSGSSISENTGFYAQAGFLGFYYNYPRPMASAVRTFADESIVQELRLVSNDGGNFDYVVGYYYQDQNRVSTQQSYLRGFKQWWDALFVGSPLIQAAVTGDQDFDYSRDEDFVDQALFGELTWHVSDRLDITGGVRAFSNEAENTTYMDLPLYAGAFTPTTSVFDTDDDGALWKLNAALEFGDDDLLYATWSQGYRRGGTNAVPTSGTFAEDPAGKPTIATASIITKSGSRAVSTACATTPASSTLTGKTRSSIRRRQIGASSQSRILAARTPRGSNSSFPACSAMSGDIASATPICRRNSTRISTRRSARSSIWKATPCRAHPSTCSMAQSTTRAPSGITPSLRVLMASINPTPATRSANRPSSMSTSTALPFSTPSPHSRRRAGTSRSGSKISAMKQALPDATPKPIWGPTQLRDITGMDRKTSSPFLAPSAPRSASASDPMTAAASPTHDVAAAIAHADKLLRLGKRTAATDAIATLLKKSPDRAEPRLLRARLDQIEGDFAAMLSAARQAIALAPDSIIASFICIEAETMAGETARARVRLGNLVERYQSDAHVLRRAAETYTHLGAHADADRCIQAACALRPDDIEAQFQAASCALAMGRLGQAEALLDDVIARKPTDFDAHYNRATLRRQTPERNHLAALETALASIGAERAPPALSYALAKEYEDLGETERSFDHLERGAAARRRAMTYNVEADVAAMREIETHFGAAFFARTARGFETEAPIFVIGLPRSGTTLVDRILSRHARVESRGELNDLALAVMRAAGRTPDKSQRIARAASADLPTLGESYVRSVRGGGASAPVFVDKTPLNFLYLGIIARALPNAKFVHLARHPMASGYAMLKTLFRMGYPFSYAQDDIARYQIAYLGLMRHWREQLGERVLYVRYEDLVNHQERETRRLLAHCELDWDPACLSFNEATSPSATASAAQVRRPLYRDSLEQWRRYAHRLPVLAAHLKAAGIDIA
ncbi:MAG: TonB-dependent receptor [Hyphomonadaceae bacterium JAD_PAG50586_4]|nr:MAG: TonB-dependent receptor [Hyphomonadaceae bacterium JAD_PAG50586_4]